MLALSKLTFSATNTTAPKHVIKDIIKISYEFVWGGTDRIKRDVLISDYQNGGLRMTDIELHFEAIKATWVKRYSNSQNVEWSLLMEKHFCYFRKNILTYMNFDNADSFPLIKSIPQFYQDVILAFNRSKTSNKPTTTDEILETIIWGNKHIAVKCSRQRNLTLFYNNWIDENIIYVKDLLITNGVINQRYIFDKLKKKANYLSEMSKLILALKQFKPLLNTNIPSNIIYSLPKMPSHHNGILVSVHMKVTSKFYYKNLLRNKCKPLSMDKWEREIIDIPPIDKIIKNKITDIRENKIKEFNYKLINQIGSCGNLVSKWNPDLSNTCNICQQVETQMHIIMKCPFVTNIWDTVSNNIGLHIQPTHIIFGDKIDRINNHLLSQIAYSIHKYWLICTSEKITPNISHLKTIITNDLNHKSLIMDLINELEIAQRFKEAGAWFS